MSKKNDEEIINSFYLYSKLSDIRKDTLKDKDLTILYWKDISQINVPSVLLIKGIKEGLLVLKSLYFELNNILRPLFCLPFTFFSYFSI